MSAADGKVAAAAAMIAKLCAVRLISTLNVSTLFSSHARPTSTHTSLLPHPPPLPWLHSSTTDACVKCGTDYCDVTGEPTFIRAVVDKHDAAAKKSGACIVNCVAGDVAYHFTPFPGVSPPLFSGFTCAPYWDRALH